MKLIRFSRDDSKPRFGVVIGERAIAFTILQQRSGMTQPDLSNSQAYLSGLPQSERVAREMSSWGEAHLGELPESEKPALKDVRLHEPIVGDGANENQYMTARNADMKLPLIDSNEQGEKTDGVPRMMMRYGWPLCLATLASVLTTPARAQDDQAAELAKQLSNPVAALISVPFQYNDDDYGGTNDGASVSRLIIQPVVPFSLNAEWNLITRTIIPIADQQGFPIPALNESGLGDITASQFFSPKEPTAGGWIWGVGPIEVLPTAAEDALGTGKWGLGPTFVVLKQAGPWTFGYLGAHVWSVGGDDDRADVDATTMQPFFSYTTKMHTTVGAYTESVYDWEGEQWQVPLIVQAGQLFKIGSQIMQLAVAGKYWADAPENGPEGWGLRVQLTLLFPKHN